MFQKKLKLLQSPNKNDANVLWTLFLKFVPPTQ